MKYKILTDESPEALSEQVIALMDRGECWRPAGGVAIRAWEYEDRDGIKQQGETWAQAMITEYR